MLNRATEDYYVFSRLCYNPEWVFYFLLPVCTVHVYRLYLEGSTQPLGTGAKIDTVEIVDLARD